MKAHFRRQSKNEKRKKGYTGASRTKLINSTPHQKNCKLPRMDKIKKNFIV